jgi:hypothetical protein
VNRFMRRLKEEIAATCSTSYQPFNFGDNSVADDISSCHDGQKIQTRGCSVLSSTGFKLRALDLMDESL